MAQWSVSMAFALGSISLSYGSAALAKAPPEACFKDATCATQELKVLVAQHERISGLKRSLAADNTAATAQFDAMLSFNEQAQASLRDWFAANAALEIANDKLAAANQRIATLQAMRADITDAAAFQALLGAETTARDILQTSLIALGTARDDKWRDFMLRRNVAVALVVPRQLETANGTPADTPVSVENVRTLNDTECSLETAASRASLDPNLCRFAGEALASHLTLSPITSASAITIPGRPLERRGVFTSISGSKDGTSLSLGIADEFKWRSFRSENGSLHQRVFSIGFSGTVKTDGGDLFSFAPEKDGETLGALDRLNAKSSLSGTLSFNVFPSERPATFTARGAQLYADARKACLEDQGKSVAASSCQGGQLVAWILAQDVASGGYAHPTHAAAFSNLYFGSPEKHARFGGGLSLEFARPGFSFIDAVSTSPSGIGSLLAAGVKPVRYDNWAIGGYLYWRIPEQLGSFDATIVPSLTYKNSWEKADDALFCPAIDTTIPFTTAKCKTLGIAAPKHVKTFVPGGELRLVWRGFRLSRFLAPEIAMAPKLTLDTDDDRWGLSVPLYFAVGDDKTLTAGLKYSREWGGLKDDGTPKDNSSGLSIVIGKTFSLNPK